MYIMNDALKLKRLRQVSTGLSGINVFFLMEKMKRSSRKFRKLVRNLMRHYPLRNRAPANDPSWELAAYQLLTMARREQKKKK